MIALTVAALAVIGVGVFTWRLPEKFRNPETAELAMTQNVDMMFRTYVAKDNSAGLAKNLGTDIDSFDAATAV